MEKEDRGGNCSMLLSREKSDVCGSYLMTVPGKE